MTDIYKNLAGDITAIDRFWTYVAPDPRDQREYQRRRKLFQVSS